MADEKKIRVLVGKVGLDGHDKGAYLVSSALRDAGFEVIYTGLRKTVAQVINASLQEDVDVIGISILSGAHLRMAEKLVAAMAEAGINDKLLVMGGVIPDEDVEKLEQIGVSAVFTQSSTYEQMTDFIKENA